MKKDVEVFKYGLSKIAYNRILKQNKGSDESVKSLVKYWGTKTCERGYIASDYDGLGILCIETVIDLGRFVNDTEATKQAVKDGVKIIPIHELPNNIPEDMRFFGWVDTPENRKKIQKEFEK